MSKTTGYALRAMAYLERNHDRWVLAREIAGQTAIAAPYLSRVLHTLAKAGLVIAKRGYQGGFRLSRPADQIAFLDIVGAVERHTGKPRCLLGLPNCSDEGACPVHALWKAARSRLEKQLARLTLAQVATSPAADRRLTSRKRRATARP